MHPILIVPLILSFLSCLYAMPYWIRRARDAGLVGKDIHKKNRPIPELGGVPVILAFLIGLLSYIALETFYFHHSGRNLEIMAALASILIATTIALIDDILGWKSGLRQWQKPLLLLLAALPIAFVNAGESVVSLPIVGLLNLGILYPLLLIPLAVSGAANGFNMLAGYNGLETGMGIIILTVLSLVAWLNQSSWVTMIALCMVFPLIALFIFNKYPAKVFPGNITTYSVGALIAVVTIMGNMERVSIILFTPYFIELLLKARGRFKKESFSRMLPDGSLIYPSKKAYSIPHIIIGLVRGIKGKAYEKDVTDVLLLTELFLVAFVILLTQV